MTSVILEAKESSTLSNLVTNGNTAATGVALTWVSSVSEDLWSTEVWVSETNDRAAAMLVDTVTTNNYLYLGTTEATYYFWIRAVSIYGKPSVMWLPPSDIAGIAGTVSKVGSVDLAPNAISLNSFGATADIVNGNGGAVYTSVVTFNITNDSTDTLPFSFNHFCKQNYTAGAKDTRWIIRDSTLDATIFDWGTITEVVSLPSLSTVYELPAGATRTIVLYWWAEDNTVSITNRSFNFLAMKSLG